MFVLGMTAASPAFGGWARYTHIRTGTTAPGPIVPGTDKYGIQGYVSVSTLQLTAPNEDRHEAAITIDNVNPWDQLPGGGAGEAYLGLALIRDTTADFGLGDYGVDASKIRLVYILAGCSGENTTNAPDTARNGWYEFCLEDTPNGPQPREFSPNTNYLLSIVSTGVSRQSTNAFQDGLRHTVYRWDVYVDGVKFGSAWLPFRNARARFECNKFVDGSGANSSQFSNGKLGTAVGYGHWTDWASTIPTELGREEVPNAEYGYIMYMDNKYEHSHAVCN